MDIFQTVKAARAQRPHMVHTSVSDGPRLCNLTFIGCTEHACVHVLCLGVMHLAVTWVCGCDGMHLAFGIVCIYIYIPSGLLRGPMVYSDAWHSRP